MVTKTYKQDPEGFKRAWLDENNKKGIRIEFPEFKERVRPVGTENPKSLEWYEHNKIDKKYVLTQDMSVIEGKAYFKDASKNPLVYTDDEIENDSFSFKKSIQNGNNADFIGCISSSIKFKVANDFFYIRDQKLTATVYTIVKPGNQIITGPLGTFKPGNTFYINQWNIYNQECVYEINQLGTYGTTFIVDGIYYNYVQYLGACSTANIGLPCQIIINESGSDIKYEMKIFTGFVTDVKLDKANNLTREITANDFMHKLADDYDVTDWYVWQYGDSNADNAQVEIQDYSSFPYLPYEGKENILYHTLDDDMYYKWISNNLYNGDYDISSWALWQSGDNRQYPVVEVNTYSDLPLNPDPNVIYKTLDTGNYYRWESQPSEDKPGTYSETSRNFRTRTIKQLRDSFWQYICNEGIEYPPNYDPNHPQTIKKKGEGFTQARNQILINDNVDIPKTLNVSPVDFDDEISGKLVGGPFKRNPKTKTETGDYDPFPQYDEYTVSGGWPVSNLVARKQVIELGLVGTLFTYGSKVETHYREYMDDCDNNGSGITAYIKIPREEQDKLRETQITAITVLQAICQYNGVFGQFNADGEFEYIKLDTLNPYEIDEKYQIEVGYSDTVMPSITGVVIFDKTSEEYAADNIQTEYGEVKNGKKGTALAYYPDDRTKIVGSDSHTYIIDDNFLFNAFNQVDAINVCKAIYDQISNITVLNANLTILAMPWLRCGQAITYYAPTENTLYPRETLAPSEDLAPSDYEKITSLIMTYEISGTGLFKGTIECKVEDVSNQIVNLNEVISAEMFYRKIGDNRTFSEFQQTANEIKMSVTDRERRLKSYIDVRADQIELAVTGPGGAMSRIELTENSIQLQSQLIELLAKDIKLNADNIELNARNIRAQADSIDIITANGVTFTDLATGGKTVISGDNITTGSIDGKYIKANSIDTNRIKFDAVTVDGSTHQMDWHKSLVIDSYYGLVGKKLGLTVDPNAIGNSQVYRIKVNTRTIKDGTGTDVNVVTGVIVESNPTGSDNLITCLTTGQLLYNGQGSSQAAYLAYGCINTSTGSNPDVWWPQKMSSSNGAKYRYVLASEELAFNS